MNAISTTPVTTQEVPFFARFLVRDDAPDSQKTMTSRKRSDDLVLSQAK